jgi:hypothetical protein
MRARHSSTWSVVLACLAGCATADPGGDAPDAAARDVPTTDIPVIASDVKRPAADVLAVEVPVALDVPIPLDVPVAPDVPIPLDVPVALDVPILPDVPAPLPDVPAPPPTARDLLVQDVCVRADGTALSNDPFDGCPAGSLRRDLGVGEALPYHRHDQPGPNAPQGYQRHDSYEAPSGRFVSTFDFAPFGEFNRAQDGYDVIEADGAFVSIIATRDGGGLAQTFYPPGCALDDAWLLFPSSRLVDGESRVARLRIAAWERMGQAFPGPCPSGFDAAFTRWQWRRAYPFGGVLGSRVKALDALVVDHYGGDNPATADHIERFYFTPLYGLTRWERWNRGATPRAEGCAGATTEGPFTRADCRDWTHIVPDATPTAPQAWPVPYAPSNLVANHDFGANVGEPWQRIGASTTGATTNWSLLRTAGDTELATNCAGPCSPGQGFFQDIPRDGLTGTLRFGARVRTDSGEGRAELVVFQRDSSARVLQRHSVALSVTPTNARWTSAPFTIDPATDHFRLQLYLNSENTFRADDFWLSR